VVNIISSKSLKEQVVEEEPESWKQIIEAIENLAVENIVANRHAIEVHKPVKFYILSNSKRGVSHGQGINQCTENELVMLD
jgi:hypothetical protein